MKTTRYSIGDSVFHGTIQALPIKHLSQNALAQVRGDDDTKYGKVAELAHNIATYGLHSPLIAVRYRYFRALGFIAAIQKHFGGHKTIEDCTPDGDCPDYDKLCFTFPLAGRRRLAAAQYLAQPDLAVFKQYVEKDEACYDHLFPETTIECRVYEDIPYESAIAIMLSENITQHRPASYKEIYAIQMLWRYSHELDPNVTLCAFARRIGLSTKTIRDIIRFVALPEPIRELAEQGRISKGKAFLLAKLQSAMSNLLRDGQNVWSEAEIEKSLLSHSTVALRGNNAMFANYLQPFLLEAYGQQTLFPDFELVAEEAAVAILTHEVLHGSCEFLKVLTALNRGLSNGWLKQEEVVKALQNGSGRVGEALILTIKTQQGLNELLTAVGYVDASTVTQVTNANAEALPSTQTHSSGS